MGIYMRMLNWSKGGFFLVFDINIVVVKMVKEGGDKRIQGQQGCCLGDQGVGVVEVFVSSARSSHWLYRLTLS